MFSSHRTAGSIRLVIRLTRNGAIRGWSTPAVRNVLHNDAAAANDHVAADGDARHDLHTCADPDVVADRDGAGVLQPLIAPFRFKRVARCIEPTVRCDENVVAKGHLRTVKDNRMWLAKKSSPMVMLQP